MNLGSLVVNIAANTASYIAGLAAASDATDKEMSSMTRSAERAGKMIAAEISGAVAAITVLVKMSINAADAMGKMAQSTGIGIDALSELSYVASLSNVSMEQFSVSMRSLNRNIADSASGIGDAGEAFKALGIDVKNADGSLKDADKVMEAVSDKFAGYADGAGKSAIAMRIFGKAGAEMIPMLNQGSEEMQKLREEGKQFGSTIGTEAAQAAEKFNDNLTKLNQVTKGVAHVVGQQLLKVMTKFTDDMLDAARNTDALAVAAETAATGMKAFLTVIVSGVAIVHLLGDSLGKLLAAFDLMAAHKWSEAFKMLKEDSADMASVIEGAVKRLHNIWEGTGDAVVIEAEKIRKAQAPLLAGPQKGGGDSDKSSAEDLRNAQKMAAEEIKAFAEAQKEAIFIAEQWQEQMDAEVITMSEVAQWTSFYRNLQLEEERRIYDERNQAMMEYYDREQEMAIQAAEEYLRIEADRAAKDKSIKQKELVARDNFLNNVAGLMNTSSRELFEIGKVGAIAQAGIKGALAVMEAWEAGMSTGGPFAPVIAAAYAAAAGLNALNLINSIRSQSFGGGGGAPTPIGQGSSGVGAPAAATAAAAPSRQSVILQVHGTSDEVKFARRIAEMLNEDGRDGGRLLMVAG